METKTPKYGLTYCPNYIFVYSHTKGDYRWFSNNHNNDITREDLLLADPDHFIIQEQTDIIVENMKAEITDELLLTIRERLEQVFTAKTGGKLEEIEMNADGSFICSNTWGHDPVIETITANDLTSDLDEIIRVRKANEEFERLENIRLRNERMMQYEAEEKLKRKIQYEKLKKEFEN